MKALIRNKGETVTEDMNIPCIDWTTGTPLTNKEWSGGPYQIVDNYIESVDVDICDEVTYPEQEDEPEPVVEDEDDYVIIDGKRYSKAELRSLIE